MPIKPEKETPDFEALFKSYFSSEETQERIGHKPCDIKCELSQEAPGMARMRLTFLCEPPLNDQDFERTMEFLRRLFTHHAKSLKLEPWLTQEGDSARQISFVGNIEDLEKDLGRGQQLRIL